MVQFLFGRDNGKQVNDEGQQQDSDKNEKYRAEVVGLGPLVRQRLTEFLKNNNHHLCSKKAAPCPERPLYKFLTVLIIADVDLRRKSKTVPMLCQYKRAV